jgi:hypothetical protein
MIIGKRLCETEEAHVLGPHLVPVTAAGLTVSVPRMRSPGRAELLATKSAIIVITERILGSEMAFLN